MRQETRKIYLFDELPDDAKERAIENYRAHNDEIFWQSEIFDSLKTLLDTAGIKLLDYSLGLDHSYIKIDLDPDVANLTGARALAWLENNLLYKLRITRAEYLKHRRDFLRYGSDYRIGKIKPCSLTGYCADDDFLDALLKDARAGNPLGDCFKWLANTYQRILQDEYDHQNSDEYISDHFVANNYEFLEDGSMY